MNRSQRLVVYDDRCGFCQSSVRVLKSLDWLHAFHYHGSSDTDLLRAAGITAEQADEELKLVSGGQIYGGFEAVRRILLRLPLTFFWAPLLGLPPVRAAGHHIYRQIAQRRRCSVK